MGYSGLIYAAIVAAWAAILVPRWVRRNEELDRAREADTARGVRVVQRSSNRSIHAPHTPVSVNASTPRASTTARTGEQASAGRHDEPSVASRLAELQSVFARAAVRRRRILTFLAAVVVATASAWVFGVIPAWTALVPGLVTVAFLVLARRAAVVQNQRRRRLMRKLHKERAAVVASHDVPEVEDVESERRLLLPPEVAPTVADASDQWSPTPVPLPTYMTKPKAPHRVIRTIDLEQTGAWTSGRLDPASSIELPRREAERHVSVPADESDPVAEGSTYDVDHRRAVGE